MLNGRQEVLRVRCTRQNVVLGEYTCKVRDRFKYAGAVVPVVRAVPAMSGKGAGARKPAAQPTTSGAAPAP
jgi:hypothetical protein